MMGDRCLWPKQARVFIIKLKEIGNMKIIYVLFGMSILTIIFAYKSGAPAGSTCAPMETSCATNGLCHSSTPNTGSGTYDITLMGGIPANGYVPGTTYTLMPWVIDTTKVLFGFQILARKSDGSKAGTVSITSNLKTKLITGNGLEYVEQTSSGATVFGIHDWMYDWTAPPQGSGKVTFYAAFVAANGNTAASGDEVYIDSLIIQESATGISENNGLDKNVSLFPNPAKDIISIHFNKMLPANSTMRIIDVNGKLVSSEILDVMPAFSGVRNINVARLKDGMYLMQILTDDGTFSINRFLKIQ
jgi:hypothetical protein